MSDERHGRKVSQGRRQRCSRLVVRGFSPLYPTPSSLSDPQLDLKASHSKKSLIQAMAGSLDIVTFIPANFGAIWTEKVLQKPAVRAFHEQFDRLSAKAQDSGISLTQI